MTRSINGVHKKRVVDSAGYSYVQAPTNPRADENGYVVEHIFLAEQALGKRLPNKSVVHHANGTLIICQDQAYHMLLHARQRALEACGNADFKKCPICKEYGDPSKMVKANGQGDLCHLSCRTWYQRVKRWSRRISST